MQTPPVQSPGVPALQSLSASHTQAPALQANPAVHACPQPPQLAASVCRLKHPFGAKQHTWPEAQAAAPLQLHWGPPDADRQDSPGTQSTPLQLQTPVASQTAPTLGLLSQWRLLPLQLQSPLMHDLPFWEPQLLPQPPQLMLSLAVAVSHPLSVPLLGDEQLANPGAQVDLQVLPEHTRPATLVVAHLRSQPPQFAMSS